MKEKIRILFVVLSLFLLFTYLRAEVEFNISYGISRPNLGDLDYLYSAQNDELLNLKNQGFSPVSDFSFSPPDFFKDFGGELKFSISSSLWLGIEYIKTKLNHSQSGNWEYEKTDVDVNESISGSIDSFSNVYDLNNFGLNLYWKFPISSFLEIEAGIGASYLRLKNSNEYKAKITDTLAFGSENAKSETKITQTWDLQTDTFGGKGGIKLKLKVTKRAGIFVGAYYSYFSPKNLKGNFRFTATTNFTSSFDNSEYKNSSTYTGEGEYHIIIKKGEGADIKYLRPEVSPAPPGEESDQGVAKSSFSGAKAVIGIFIRL